MSTHKLISDKIASMKSGIILFPTDFRGTGSDTAIKMSLSRFASAGKLSRLSNGIYVKPSAEGNDGILLDAEGIAEAIAEKESVKIKPAGALAQFKLGIAKQMPDQLTYVTDGEPRKLVIGEKLLVFKSTTPKKLSMQGPISSLVIQILEEVGQKNIDQHLLNKLELLIQKEDYQLLLADMKKAAAWIYNLLWKLLDKLNKDGKKEK